MLSKIVQMKSFTGQRNQQSLTSWDNRFSPTPATSFLFLALWSFFRRYSGQLHCPVNSENEEFSLGNSFH